MWLNYMFPWFHWISSFALWSNIDKWKNWYKAISCNWNFSSLLKILRSLGFYTLYKTTYSPNDLQKNSARWGHCALQGQGKRLYSAICSHCFVWPFPLNQMGKRGTYGVWTGRGSQQAWAVDSVACCCAFMFEFQILLLICVGAEARPIEAQQGAATLKSRMLIQKEETFRDKVLTYALTLSSFVPFGSLSQDQRALWGTQLLTQTCG